MLYLHTIKDKYIEIYNKFQTAGDFTLVTETLIKTNPHYDIVIKRLHLYYDMKLVTFRIDWKRNLVIQFPVFVQPYTQEPLILYQLDTIPVPIVNKTLKHILIQNLE